MARSKAFAAFEIHAYRWLFISNMTFMLAMQGQMLVRSMLTYQLTGSAFNLGLVNFAVAVPMLLLGPWGGVVADRVERKQLLIIGTCMVVAAESTILFLYFAGLLQFWHLMCSAFVMGCVIPLTMPAQSAMVVDVVGKRDLQNAMALSMGGMAATRIIGPTLSGFLVAVFGLGGAYSVGVSFYALSALAIVPVTRNINKRDIAATTALADLVEGVRYVRDNRLVMSLLVFGIVPMFLAAPFQSLLVVFTESVWHVGSQGLGLLYAISGAGGLLGSIFVARLPDSYARLKTMIFTLFCFAFLLMGFALSPWYLLALPLALAANACTSIFSAVNNASIQILVPDEVRGRVSSFMMMSFSVTPLGTLPMSWVAEHYGAPMAVSLASAMVVVVVALFLIFSKSLRNIDREVEAVLGNRA